MSGLGAKIATLPDSERVYILRALPEHLAAAGQGSRLGQLVGDRGWLNAQRAFDPSLQIYCAGLGLAIQSAERGEASGRSLPLLMVLSLLHSTARSMQANLPAEALEAISRAGQIDRARYLAQEQPQPWQRSDALLAVARVEMGLGDRTGAAQTIALARQEAAAIQGPAGRCQALLPVVQAEFANIQDQASCAAQLRNLYRLADSIADGRTKTHMMAAIAGAAQGVRLADLPDQAAGAIQKVYRQASEALATAEKTHSRPGGLAMSLWPDSSRNTAPGAALPLAAMVRLARDCGILDCPAYLLAVARADAADLANYAKHAESSFSGLGGIEHWAEYANIVPAVLRAAGARGDRVTCDRIAKLLLDRTVVEGSYISPCSLCWNAPAVIEAFGEIGYSDTALALIAQRLIETADVSDLRQALARGAGQRGDIQTIERAAGPIAPAGRPGTLGERLQRGAEGAKKGVEMAAASWALGLPVSGAEAEKIEVYLAGYQGLTVHDHRRAETFLAGICQKFGPGGEKLIQEALAVGGLDRLTTDMFARGEGLVGAIARLSGELKDEMVEERVASWLKNKDFERALAAAGAVKDLIARSRLLADVSQGLIEAGQFERGLALAETVPDESWRRHAFESAAAFLAGGPVGEAADWIGRVTAGLGNLRAGESLSRSPALPALAAAFAAYATAAEALALIEPLGPDAILAAFDPLSAAAARQETQTAQALLAWLGQQAASAAKVQAACAAVRNWAPQPALVILARRAYEMAIRDARALKFTATAYERGASRHIDLLAAMAGAGRALRDREVLLDLLHEAKQHVSLNGLGSADEALVDIAAGLAGLGESLRYDALVDFPPFKTISWHYHGLAQLEMADAMAALQPEDVYRARPRGVLSAAGSMAIDKVETLIEGHEPARPTKEPAVSWRNYRAHWAKDELYAARRRLVLGALEGLPELPKVKPARKRESGGQKPGSAPPRETSVDLAPGWMGFQSRFSTGRQGGDNGRLWLRMIAVLAANGAYDAIPRVVLAARLAGPPQPRLFSEREVIGLPAVVDAGVAALVAGGKYAEARALTQLVPEQGAGVEVRLAASAATVKESVKILVDALKRAWNAATLKAVAETAPRLPDRAARLRVAVYILSRAREQGRLEVLNALGALTPLAGSLLAPAELREAIGNIFASESYW